jgi:heme/copper-type cytochrome/quinol oxidase subunit 2
MRFSFADGLFWTSVAFCLVAQVLIVRSVLGARHLPTPAADVPKSRGPVELLWALVPAVGLAVLLVFTWQAMREHQATTTPPVVELPR